MAKFLKFLVYYNYKLCTYLGQLNINMICVDGLKNNHDSMCKSSMRKNCSIPASSKTIYGNHANVWHELSKLNYSLKKWMLHIY